jgi:hypothetical protein
MPQVEPFPAYGVHRRYGADARVLTAELRAEGWRVFLLRRATDKTGFFAEAAAALPLNPPVRTPNWDAFNDSLSSGLMDLSEPKLAIVWEDAEAMRREDGDTFSTVYEILANTVFVLADPTMTGDGPVSRLLVLLLFPRPLARTDGG